eukprot:UN03559
MLVEGATPKQIDDVMYKDVGCAMGIFAVSDLSGIDIGYKSRKDTGRLKSTFDYGIGDILVEKYGRLGLKVGKGYYDYPNLPKSRKGVPSKLVNDLIIEQTTVPRIKKLNISSQDIIERVFYPFINEGFKVLEEGIVII